jgi:hypothetical protein
MTEVKNGRRFKSLPRPPLIRMEEAVKRKMEGLFGG